MIEFLLDQGLPRSTVQHLQGKGLQSVHVGDLGLAAAIRIRIQGLKGDGVARVIHQVLQAVKSDLLAGAAVTVTERRLALRRLPLIPANRFDHSDDEATGG